MGKIRNKILISGLATLAAVILGLTIYGYRFTSHFAESQMERLLQTDVEFSDISFDLMRRRVSLHKVKIFDPKQPEKIIGNIKRLSLRAMEIPLVGNSNQLEIILDHPDILFETNRRGEWVLSNKIPLMRRGKGEARLKPFNVEDIRVKDGRIVFQDGRVNKKTQVTDANLSLHKLRLPTPEEKHPSKFEATLVVAGSKMKLKGRGDFLSPKTSLQAQWTVTGFPLPPYAPYYDRGLPVRIQRGTADFSTQARIEGDRVNIPIHARVNNLGLELKKRNAFNQFGSDLAVKSLTNERGEVELDLVVKGNLQRPLFVILTDFKKAAMAGMTDPFKKAGSKIKEGTKTGFGKVKNFFSGK